MAGPGLTVVTRTRGRSLLLQRAGRGLAAALPPASEWIVVCDDPEPDLSIEPMARGLGLPRDTRILVLQTGGAGRAAALNAGICAATGRAVHIHDDDDTVEPAFYARTLAFLDDRPAYGAVVTWVERRTEAIRDGIVHPLSAVPHNPGLRHVTFAKLASACLFPPIAFLARRECVTATGPIDETLEVAEDYDFFLRFLSLSDIGVLPERLCAVHVRERSGPDNALTNSAASYDFEEVDALYRNAKFRQDLKSGQLGLGWLMLIGELAKTTSRLDALLAALRRMPMASRLARLLH